MLFNLEKCSVMHMGKGNKELSYVMGGKVLKGYHDNSSTDISSTTPRLQTFRLQTFRLL